jgi:2,3-bisphosphoglycerate-independent phosphoglycerate mutase
LAHLKELCQLATAQGLQQVYVHAFTDGRDTDPKSGKAFLADLLKAIEGSPVQLASVIGRYYAMDRDRRWERIRLAYELLTQGRGEPTGDLLASVQAAYDQGLTDEFMPALVNVNAQGRIQPDDVVICFNFRTDRCRQITEVLTQTAIEDMKPLPLHYYTMTRYDERFEGIGVFFEKDNLQNTLGEVLAKAGKTQLRMAETEKYPHVTFFFSGGREQVFEGETRLMVASPKVATYDLQPEMSAKGITDELLAHLAEQQPDFICLNYANADMVGHTGVFQAAVKAAETVDECLGRLLPVLAEKGYGAFIVADHGNSDYMINPDGSPNTAHTKNPVPCILFNPQEKAAALQLPLGIRGKLADLAPSILTALGLDIPKEMDGTVLWRFA